MCVCFSGSALVQVCETAFIQQTPVVEVWSWHRCFLDTACVWRVWSWSSVCQNKYAKNNHLDRRRVESPVDRVCRRHTSESEPFQTPVSAFHFSVHFIISSWLGPDLGRVRVRVRVLTAAAAFQIILPICVSSRRCLFQLFDWILSLHPFCKWLNYKLRWLTRICLGFRRGNQGTLKQNLLKVLPAVQSRGHTYPQTQPGPLVHQMSM